MPNSGSSDFRDLSCEPTNESPQRRKSKAPLAQLFFLALIIEFSGPRREADTAHKVFKARI
jgi:hypothetical protein